MGMVLDGKVEPVQLGALLLVLRYRTETPAELAGFVRAARARLVGAGDLAVDLDWPSYADRAQAAALLPPGSPAAGAERCPGPDAWHPRRGSGDHAPGPRRARARACGRRRGCRPAARPRRLRLSAARGAVAAAGRAVRPAPAPGPADAGAHGGAGAEPVRGTPPDPGRLPPDLSRAAPGDPAPARPEARRDLQGRRRRGAAQPRQAVPGL